ncbi:MAG: tetratricopeptide repeat protein [Patescibacteria group bacterium]|nr:tetratricopeptide repeat protein [Patescibacteria group bacterium]
MFRCYTIFVALFFVVSCGPEEAIREAPRTPSPTLSQSAPTKQDQNVLTAENCKEEDGFKLVEGKCVDKEVTKKEPEPPPVAKECPNGDFKDCTLQCDRGNAVSCLKLSGMYLKGENGARKDPARSKVLLQKACDTGLALACVALAMIYFESDDTRDYVRAAELLRPVCASSTEEEGPAACVLLGIIYEKGAGAAQDLAKAAELYRKACEAKPFYGCSRLGKMYEQGKGVPKDLKKAEALYKKACEANNKEGCAAIAAQKRAEQSKNWRVMTTAEFSKHAGTILDVGVAANPSLAIQGMGLLPLVMVSQMMTPAEREYAFAEFFANTYFENDVVITADKKFKVSPGFLEMYRKAAPIKAKMRAQCLQDCLASDVRATKDACTAICNK